MALFLAIVTLYITSIAPFLLSLNDVDVIPSCRGIIFPVPLFFKTLPFFIYAGGLSGLSRLKMS